ncbi:YbaB/EbfC family nucleoid-associated protein [Nonomuraea phyllanthi]|uniref:YbaB/EbfC family nucleoid-associated protein n=1 Tax=Nonomuraea phyllanthi TaxID=2219224 RepID=UPI00186AD650|nr:YbaB/EbfC family nucleoid-associated protein [Nonomuraea phyllanthi]
MEPQFGSDEELRAYLDRAREAVRGLRRARESLMSIAGSAADDDGLVTATCDGDGRVSRVWFDPRAMRYDRVALGRLVTEVLQAAQQDARRQALEITGAILGDELPEPPTERVVRDRIDRVTQDILEA